MEKTSAPRLVEEFERSLCVECDFCVDGYYRATRDEIKEGKPAVFWCISCGGSGLRRTEHTFRTYVVKSGLLEAPYINDEIACVICKGATTLWVASIKAQRQRVWCQACGGSGLYKSIGYKYPTRRPKRFEAPYLEEEGRWKKYTK